jgi:carbamoyl-phosphate synthase small subunit
MKATLLLEDGTAFDGFAFGAEGEAYGEVVFNTSLTGYQEVLTDPSYRGQIVSMTYPLIGNYGVNGEDPESERTWLSGFVVKELSAVRSNWRSSTDLDSYLRSQGVVGIRGIDTRALTRHLRVHGSQHAVLYTGGADARSMSRKLAAAPRIVGVDLVKEVTCSRPYAWTLPLDRELPSAWKACGREAPHVVVIDCGVKRNILRHLVSAGCRPTVVPASTSAAEILELEPDGLLLSNGPGDPQPVSYVIRTAQELLGRLPIFGICLGHQMLGLAMGGRTYKLKFGHHGANHPVQETRDGTIAITSQNHGFNVDMGSIPLPGTRMTHVNLYDHTMEGMENVRLRAFSVQYHPEAGPGPHDAQSLFGKFVRWMKRGSGARKARAGGKR